MEFDLISREKFVVLLVGGGGRDLAMEVGRFGSFPEKTKENSDERKTGASHELGKSACCTGRRPG